MDYPIQYDFTPNALKIPDIRKQLEEKMIEQCIENVPTILDREGKIKPLLTHRIGFYSVLLKEARNCYKSSLSYATIAMIGITAERFSIEFCEKLRLHINDHEISMKEAFGKRVSQKRRLTLLKKAGLINDLAYQNLNKITKTRNKYVHPNTVEDPENDALHVLNLMIDVLNSDFSEKYEIRDGKIVSKNP